MAAPMINTPPISYSPGPSITRCKLLTFPTLLWPGASWLTVVTSALSFGRASPIDSSKGSVIIVALPRSVNRKQLCPYHEISISPPYTRYAKSLPEYGKEYTAGASARQLAGYISESQNLGSTPLRQQRYTCDRRNQSLNGDHNKGCLSMTAIIE